MDKQFKDPFPTIGNGSLLFKENLNVLDNLYINEITFYRSNNNGSCNKRLAFIFSTDCCRRSFG